MRHKKLLHLILIVFSLIVLSPFRISAEDGQVVQQVSANGQRNLRPFTVKDKWEILK